MNPDQKELLEIIGVLVVENTRLRKHNTHLATVASDLQEQLEAKAHAVDPSVG